MTTLALDVETTTIDKGHPFNADNRLCTVGIGTDVVDVSDIEYSSSPYKDQLHSIRTRILASDLLVGFNIKFDLHWLRRYGIRPNPEVKIWDVQLAFFIMTGQENPYPSLEQVAAHYGVPGKIDEIKLNYWDKGIDTPDIPWEKLEAYQAQDVKLTYQLYEKQWAECSPLMRTNILRACKDLLMTAEMEWNGLKFDKALSIEKGNKIDQEMYQIKVLLDLAYPVKNASINWNSNQQLSKVLFGGVLEVEGREPYDFTYKSGKMKGMTVVKERKVINEVTLPRLCDPLKNSETSKEGVYKTDEATLLSLRPHNPVAKEIIKLVLTYGKLDKKLGTYYWGIPKKMEEKNWQNDYLHGGFNHCRAGTGRLSSSDPNLQNLDEEIRECLITRFN